MWISQARSTTSPEESISLTSGKRRQNNDQTYQLPMNAWSLDMTQQSITLEINRSILEQWTKFVNIARFEVSTQTNRIMLCERRGQIAILAVKNKDVDDLNTKIQSQINWQIHSFKLINSITDPNEVINYPTEFLNWLDLPGLTPHNLQLKVGWW